MSNPLMERIAAEKLRRRKDLAALPYPEKVRIVEKLREASIKLRNTGARSRSGSGN